MPCVGLCTPDRILIKVDFPAPLSPSRQWTSPPSIFTEMPHSAFTRPKDFVTSLSSMIAVIFLFCLLSAPESSLAQIIVQQHRCQQHGTQDRLEPVCINIGVKNTLLHHPENERADSRA